ncbi:MAG: M4 family metallopeptidase [Chitinophagaceae bacterium]|uniref:M4 family metallopeptidase n=1 Tax=unclassified Paraflavitalea TaxID=2798305 RepID=UPI003D33803E|nr:M4 family metallopeptidase [Chitinophagaceae bacterium]
MNRIRLSLSLIALLASGVAMAQKPTKSIAAREGLYPEFIEFSAADAPKFSAGQVLLTAENGVARSSVASKLAARETDRIGMEHFRYNQVLNGYVVENTAYIVHTKAGKIMSQNGVWVKEEIASSLKTAASIDEPTALKMAMSYIGASTYKWQIPDEELALKDEMNNRGATYFPKGQLVYYSGVGEVNPSNLQLTYKFDIYSQFPLGRKVVYVDANAGTIIGENDLINTVDAAGSATTAYSGVQAITTDNTGTTYRLRETGRGLGVQTLDMRVAGTNYNAAVDFTDADNSWNNVNANKDQYATDAHWGAEKTYDFYLTKFGRNSIDNAGYQLRSYVHVNLVAFGYANNINAFWDGTRMSYGDGGTSGTTTYSPLTTLDIAGHEITHGLTSRTSNLVYSNESGALNEAFSDILGTSIEWFGKGTGNWTLGDEIGGIFRSMSNPNLYGDPDTYQGTNWATGTADNGGVHTNSGVLNFWFYLLTTGGSGTNDKGFAYNVTGIGIDKAAAIAYRTNTVYLTANSNYAAARTYGIKSAEDLYGVGSVEAVQTANAFDAVGVTAVVVPPTCTDTYEANETRTAAKVIALNTDINAKIGSSTDKDWFRFTTVTAQPKFKVTLSGLAADYDLRLYNSSGSQLAISQNSGTTSETITRNTATAGATYYLQVYGFSGANSASCYTLKVQTSATNLFGIDENAGILKSDATTKPGVYPNPARNTVTVRFVSQATAQKEINITDMLGRIVYRQRVAAVEGMNNVTISLPTINTGVYVVKVDQEQVSKLTIAK